VLPFVEIASSVYFVNKKLCELSVASHVQTPLPVVPQLRSRQSRVCEVGELEDEGDDGDGDVEGLETGWKLIP
jgi:hypothetical protein